MSNTNDIAEESEDNSDDNLQIVIDSPVSKRKTPPKPSKSEKLIIQSFEDELERTLEEKAAKTNLNAIHVKNIIKHVVTNEHVLALVKKAENPNEFDESIPYEPKLTRAKAKELLSSAPPIPWSTPKPTSEVQVLFSEDLQEDSSGDEYVPCEEESEDDRDSSIISDPPSVPPPTPPPPLANTDSGIQTSWTDDGIFKIPPNKSKEDIEEEANIARRTRSKLSLSATPLEEIEEAFIPPDITTDMYDMDCDNEDWMDFLQKFTRPLDEVAKATEDEEQDPEYNILADEEIDKIDKEELRVDRAVKVTRKELNNLIAELFEDTEFCTNAITAEIDKRTKSNEDENGTNMCEALNNTENVQTVDVLVTSQEEDETSMVVINETDIIEEDIGIVIRRSQIPLLEQQIRQHIQILTQNFILTYQHPELHSFSVQTKEYLMNFFYLCEGKERSMFYAHNLRKAIELVEYWEKLLATNSTAVKDMKRHVTKTMEKCIQSKQSDNSYIPDFPQLILETISNSEVFLYPSLLPKIPFKPNKVVSRLTQMFTDFEDQLIAIGLEQFEPMLKQDRKNLSKKTLKVKPDIICSYIQEYMMPHMDVRRIYYHVNRLKTPRCGSNPIKYYFHHGRAPPVVHYVCPLHELQILPPCKRNPDQLPYQWKTFIYPPANATTTQTVTVVNIIEPQVFQLSNIERPILPKGPVIIPAPVVSTPQSKLAPFKKRSLRKPTRKVQRKRLRKDPITKFIECLNRPSVINRLFAHDYHTQDQLTEEINSSTDSSALQSTSDTMLPNMPSLGTPMKKYSEKETVSTVILNTDKKEGNVTNIKSEIRKSNFPEISTISSSSFQQSDTSTEVEFCRPTDNCQTVTSISKIECSETFLTETVPSNYSHNEKGNEPNPACIEKDNLDSAQTSSVKPPGKKEPSGAEKKRAKLRREFLANLSVTAPEDVEIEKQKSEMFALAYYDKMRENLELEDYHKVMQILNDHEEGDAVDLYKKIEKIFVPKYQELADEFLLFLREKEAAAVGQLIPWITMNNRSKFLRKLEIYFKDQPAQLRKIYKCLTELSQTVDISMEKIKSSLLPMFKGNAVLSDLFLQNFLSERPPPSLLEGPYENLEITNEPVKQEVEEIFETITVPDTEDKYGGPSCICNCHQIEDPEFKSRYRHCIRCGTRFTNGKVFIQSGKGLRPARVSFLTNPQEDHSVRLIGKTAPNMPGQQKKSPSKQVILSSPTKENPDEETEDETDSKKKPKRRSPKKKSENTSRSSKEPQIKIISKRKRSAKNNRSSKGNPTGKEYKPVKKRKVKKCKEDDKITVTMTAEKLTEEKDIFKPGATLGQQKRLAEDSLEWEDSLVIPSSESKPKSPDQQTAESESELKPNSPDQQTAESESEFCEESSQDNCESDSNSSISSFNNQSQSDSNAGEECSWTREEDKIILETFQKENDKEHAFTIIADQLKNRSVPQISNRFQTLMTLLLHTLGNS